MSRSVLVPLGAESLPVYRSFGHLFLVAAVVAMSSALVVHGQALTGYVSGRVFDVSGKLISGAAVSLTDRGTQQKRATVTGPTGDFVFPEVLPGSFDLQ